MFRRSVGGLILALGGVSASLSILTAYALAGSTEERPGSEGDVKSLFEQKCSACHEPEKALTPRRSLVQWRSTVARMAAKLPGHISPEQSGKIAEYLGTVAGSETRRAGLAFWAVPLSGAAAWLVALGTMLAGLFHRRLGRWFRFHKFGAGLAVMLWIVHLVCMSRF